MESPSVWAPVLSMLLHRCSLHSLPACMHAAGPARWHTSHHTLSLSPRYGSQLEQQQYLEWARQLAAAVEGPLRLLSSQIWHQGGPPDQAALWLLRLVADLAAAWPRSLGSTSAAGYHDRRRPAHRLARALEGACSSSIGDSGTESPYQRLACMPITKWSVGQAHSHVGISEVSLFPYSVWCRSCGRPPRSGLQRSGQRRLHCKRQPLPHWQQWHAVALHRPPRQHHTCSGSLGCRLCSLPLWTLSAQSSPRVGSFAQGRIYITYVIRNCLSSLCLLRTLGTLHALCRPQDRHGRGTPAHALAGLAAQQGSRKCPPARAAA